MQSTRFDKVKTLTYIHQRLQQGETPSLKEVAEVCHITHYHFSRVFAQQLGVTFQEYISAFKVEQSIDQLLQGKNVTTAHLQSGFQSSSTFSTTFKQHTGITPKQYLNNIETFSHVLNTQMIRLTEHCVYYYSFEHQHHEQSHPLHISIANLNKDQPAFVFVGLYPKPIPKGEPVVGIALNQVNACDIRHIPDGTYYVLLCELSLSADSLDYYDLSHARRNIYNEPIVFPLSRPLDIEIELREALVSDPPITVNLPRMLLEGVYQSFLE